MSAVVAPGRDNVADQLMGLPDAEAGLSHQADFTIRFQIQHRSNSPSVDLRLDAALIVPTRLYLVVLESGR